jgi:hypothetical protein
MTAEGLNSGTNRCSISTQWYRKHVSVATDTDTIIVNTGAHGSVVVEALC